MTKMTFVYRSEKLIDNVVGKLIQKVSTIKLLEINNLRK